MTINVIPEPISEVADVEIPISDAQAEAEEDARRSDPVNAYCEFLAMELRLLNKEMGMDGPGYFSPCNTIAHDFHFPDAGWHSVPQPSTRAAMMLRAVGILPPVEAKGTVNSIDLEDQLYHSKMRASLLCEMMDLIHKSVTAIEKLHGIELWKFTQLDSVNYLAHEISASANEASAIYYGEVSA